MPRDNGSSSENHQTRQKDKNVSEEREGQILTKSGWELQQAGEQD